MRRSIAFAVAAALLAGCANLPERGQVAPAPVAPNSEQMVQAGQLARYAKALQSLQGNPTTQAEVMASALSGYNDAKAGPAALLYGLLLAAPDHQGRDLTRAQHVLQEALARAELLSTTEKALGEVELRRVGNELRLMAEIERLVADLKREKQEHERTAAASANPAQNRRLQAEIDESARLRKALDEAKAKLDAITRLERGISDRPPASEGRNP